MRLGDTVITIIILLSAVPLLYTAYCFQVNVPFNLTPSAKGPGALLKGLQIKNTVCTYESKCTKRINTVYNILFAV